MTKIRIKSDWNHGAIMYVLKTRYDQYVKNKAVRPICLYCSSDVGGLYPYAICAFAIKRPAEGGRMPMRRGKERGGRK